MKPAKKLFVYKLKLSLAVINLADMIINNLSWIFQIQKEFATPFEEISP